MGALKKRDGEKEMEFVKVCEMFEEMEKVKLDRAKLFRMSSISCSLDSFAFHFAVRIACALFCCKKGLL